MPERYEGKRVTRGKKKPSNQVRVNDKDKESPMVMHTLAYKQPIISSEAGRVSAHKVEDELERVLLGVWH